MIDRQKGKLVIECDSCNQTFEGDSGEWSEVWPVAKRDGWSAYTIGAEWLHRCPRCKGKSK